MKIVCFIKPKPPLIYFVNKINEKYPVLLAIIEKENTESWNIFSRIRKYGIRGRRNILNKKIIKREGREVDYAAFFGSKWQALDKGIECLETNNINSDAVMSRLKEVEPDLILDHGTAIVEDYILETSKLALNLHWGLSPYYRGTYCTDWALINRDPYNIGVTIHKLTKDIDGGDILAQRRAEIRPNDTVHSINMQLTYLGTELILEAINKLNNGKQLNFRKQDLSLGSPTCFKQWNHALDGQIKYIERNNVIEAILNKPSRDDRLPIVDMK